MPLQTSEGQSNGADTDQTGSMLGSSVTARHVIASSNMVLTKTKAIIELSTIETQTASLSARMLSNSRTVGKGEQLVRPSSGKQQIKVQLCAQVLVNQQPLQSDHSPIHPANKSSEY